MFEISLISISAVFKLIHTKSQRGGGAVARNSRVDATQFLHMDAYGRYRAIVWMKYTPSPIRNAWSSGNSTLCDIEHGRKWPMKMVDLPFRDGDCPLRKVSTCVNVFQRRVLWNFSICTNPR